MGFDTAGGTPSRRGDGLMGLRWWNLCVLLFWSLFIGQEAWAYPHDYVWRTLETEHFRINYPDELAPLSQDIGRMAEAIHAEMAVLLDWEPNYRTEMTIVDHVDSANGWANVYPDNRTTLFMVPPDGKSNLNDYDDWMRVLISHEYTHVMALDTKSGFPQAVNYIFGGLWHPNQYMPRWYTEGMAVVDESHFTAGGRERSSTFEMMLRADVLEGRFFPIDTIGGDIATWPGNTLWYLYGSKFMQYLTDKYGHKQFAALGYLIGKRVIPYGLNSVLEQAVGQNWPDLYEEWYRNLKTRYEEDMRRLERIGLTEVHDLTFGGLLHDDPRLLPNQKELIYFHSDYKRPGGLYKLNVQTLEAKEILSIQSINGFTLSPDGRSLIYGATSSTEFNRSWNDLFEYDLETGEGRRLTEGRRMREPAVSPDGRHIAACAYTPGAAHLEIIDRDSGTTTEPLSRERFDQVFTPVFSPDGKSLAFASWKRGGGRDIHVLHLADNTLVRVTADHAVDASPTWSPDGRFVLFSSDRTGIFNIFAYEPDSDRLFQVTNVKTGAFTPQLTADGRRLFFSHFHAGGYELAYADTDARLWREVAKETELRPSRVYNDPPVTFEDREYSVFPSILPKVWVPTWGTDAEGDTLGVALFGRDATDENSWRMEVDYGLKSKQPVVGVSYGNSSLPVNLSTRFVHTSYTLPQAVQKDGVVLPQKEARFSGGISAGFSLRKEDLRFFEHRSYSHSFSMGYSWRYTRVMDRYKYSPTEPEPIYADTGFGSGLSFSWSYGDTESYGYFGANAYGRGFYLSSRVEDPILGSKYSVYSMAAGWTEYLKIPWWDDHGFATRLIGGTGFARYNNRAVYYIGGPPERDIVDDLIKDERGYGDYIRGYKPGVLGGDHYVVLNVEYRANLWTIERGISTYPLFFKRLHLAPFVDVGNAWVGTYEYKPTLVGTGAELRLDMIMGYLEPVTLRLGYMVGLLGDESLKNNAVLMVLDGMF